MYKMMILISLTLLIFVSSSLVFDSVENLTGNSIQSLNSKKPAKKHSKGGLWKLTVSNNKNYRVYYRDPFTKKRYTYQLLQLHSHVKSEHTVNGKQYPFEIHFVHQLVTKAPKYKYQYLVIGILADHNKKRKRIFTRLNANKKSVIRALPNVVIGHRLIHYKGSLTTPPYNEAVNWFVVKRTYYISKKKVSGFHKDLKSKTGHLTNHRSVCKLYGRKLFSVSGSAK